MTRNYEKHGMTGTRLHQVWLDMRCRCSNKNHKQYKYWGGKGIKVCSEWDNSFIAFMNFAYSNGYNETYVIDRIDSEKDYCPSNCRFVSPCVNARNTSKVKLTLSDAVNIHKMIANGVSQKYISNLFGIEYSVVSSIKTNRIWKESKQLAVA